MAGRLRVSLLICLLLLRLRGPGAHLPGHNGQGWRNIVIAETR